MFNNVVQLELTVNNSNMLYHWSCFKCISQQSNTFRCFLNMYFWYYAKLLILDYE